VPSSEIPHNIAVAAQSMAGYPSTWALCGGWAVDAWLGRKTRDHGDIDITVFHDDQRLLLDHLAGWHMVAHDAIDPGPTEELWAGRELVLPVHLHTRQPGAENLALLMAWVTPPYRAADDGLDFEFVLNARDGDDLILNEDPALRAPLGMYIEQSPWGLPTVTPALLLFWKATAYFFNPRFEKRNSMDEADFRALVPHMSGERRDWLRNAIATLHADHPLLAALA
jgi:hypothetical protein